MHIFDHRWISSLSKRATAILIDSCTGARGANLLVDLDRSRSAGAQVLRGCLRHGWVRRLPADRPAQPVYISRLVL